MCRSDNLAGKWFLVLGASSGFGAAACRKAAQKGLNVIGVHLDRKSTMPMVEELVADLNREGVAVHFFNVNAADADRRREVLDEVARLVGPEGGVRVLMHSLAFGILKPFIASDGAMEEAQMDMTANVMAHSLVYWAQDLVARNLFDRNGRIFAMTSAGGARVLPNYGAVSAAKAALESHVRQLAMELAPLQITANAIRAGVTDTPALRKIPGNEKFIDKALAQNPNGRLTTPEDVAEAILLLSEPASYWMTGNTLGVDGGEDIIG